MYGKRNDDEIKDKMKIKHNVWYVRCKKIGSVVAISKLFTVVRFRLLRILGPILLDVEKFSISSLYFY
jgi:hypothetical protein